MNKFLRKLYDFHVYFHQQYNFVKSNHSSEIAFTFSN